MEQGYSLTEVLVSLFLMTITSVTLLKQQLQISQLFNEMHARMNALVHLDNASERIAAGDHVSTIEPPYTLTAIPTHMPTSIEAQISWGAPSILKRKLLTELTHD